ncbi:MAG: 2-phosphosulfolactate phosphatase [Pedosphaera sp.]|nr:2-phosphosulfolactate phosphatase [Pedosphaera sp.]
MNRSKPTSLDVLFTPAEFEALSSRDLSGTTCVVFDVLRATSSMITALANGAEAILPAADIPEAMEIHRQRPEVLLAGERDGLRIGRELTGSVAFDLGNSPREFTAERVAARTIAMTTTNGTRALKACANARTVLIGAFLNLGALTAWIDRERPSLLLLVCSGTREEASYEDTLGAGALCAAVWSSYASGHVADSAQIAREIYLAAKGDLLAAAGRHARNARRLLEMPDIRDDVAFCLRLDAHPILAVLGKDGRVRRG